jgi:hypothetical protein
MSGPLQPLLLPRPLAAITAKDAPDGIGGRPNLTARPYRVEWRGKAGTAATDGHVLVALWGDDSGADLDPQRALALVSVLEERGELRRGVAPMRALLEWCGPAVREEDLVATREACGECDGTGETECECPRCHDGHEADCEACDGRGTVETVPKIDERYGSFAGVCLSRNLLASTLECVPAVEDLEIAAAPSLSMAWIDGGLWRVVIMGVSAASEEVFAGLAEVPV